MLELLSNQLSSPFSPLDSNGSKSKPTIRFVDIAELAGLRFQHVSGSPEKKYLPETFVEGLPRLTMTVSFIGGMILAVGGNGDVYGGDVLYGMRVHKFTKTSKDYLSLPR